MNKLIAFRVNSEHENKINQIKNKSEFLNNLIENYYESEKKSTDEISKSILNLENKFTNFEKNYADNFVKFNEKINQITRQLYNLISVNYKTEIYKNENFIFIEIEKITNELQKILN